LPSIEFDEDRPPRSREELLAMVRRDGLRRRYRRHGLIGSVALVLVAALAIPVIAGGDDGGQRNVAATDQPTTTVEQTTTTGLTGGQETTTTVVDNAPTATVASPTTRPPTTTAAVPGCRNSYEERCGPFRWEPDPGPNAPLTVEISYSPSAPKAGQQVTFTVVARDADAIISSECAQHYGEGPLPFGCDGIPSCRTRYGPWTPPQKSAGERTFSYAHTYDDAGTYRGHFSFLSGTGPFREYCGSPYGNSGIGEFEIVVSANPVPV
jgi:hypothetical protein